MLLFEHQHKEKQHHLQGNVQVYNVRIPIEPNVDVDPTVLNRLLKSRVAREACGADVSCTPICKPLRWLCNEKKAFCSLLPRVVFAATRRVSALFQLQGLWQLSSSGLFLPAFLSPGWSSACTRARTLSTLMHTYTRTHTFTV